MPPPSPDATAFVLVPGGMSPSHFYHKVTDKLRSSGYIAIPIDLPSVGDSGKSAPATIFDDATHVRYHASEMLAQGKKVVLVGNGYGGLVITEAAKGLDLECKKGRGQLIGLVYLASLLGPVGANAFELVSEQLLVDIKPPGPEISYLPPPPAAAAGAELFNDLPVEEQSRYGEMLRPHSAIAMIGRLTYAAYEEYPATVVVPTRDKAVSTAFQLQKLEEVLRRGVCKGQLRKVMMEGDHIIMLSHPEKVAEVLIEAAAGKI